MQNLDAVAAKLGTIAAAFKDGGLYFLIGVGMFLAYLAFSAWIKRKRQATQEINIGLPPAPDGSTGLPGQKVCPLHSGIESQIDELHKFRGENREDHGRIFNQLQDLSVAIASKK